MIKLENVSLGDCSNGIEIEVYCESGAITTKNFEFGEWQFNEGPFVLPHMPKSFNKDLLLSQRYYEKSNNYSVAPGEASSLGNGLFIATTALAGSTAGNVGTSGAFPFKERKMKSPTMTFYDFDGTANACRVYPADAKRSGITAYASVKEVGAVQFLSFDNSSATAISAGNQLVGHWTANARPTIA